MSEVSPLAEPFKSRCKRVWELVNDEELGEAFEEAAALLLEPRLDPFQQTSMHLLLTFSHNNGFAEHAPEVARLCAEMGPHEDLKDSVREELVSLRSYANHILDKARELKAEYDRRVKEILLSSKGMDELHKAQIEEMHQQLDAKEATTEAEAAQNDDDDDDADSQRTETGYPSDNDLMPDILRLQL
ncbi:hypothetical protein NW762_002964 [Fusarium torreyae]|uniref:Uncharacterized protein n=1 Tax=Fusarium torreyae TaxID=1237075 RepID=A0A9W8VJ30_9HYPO|nr:hypothetical protein NW762_002964 [Fusarium torreyae]